MCDQCGSDRNNPSVRAILFGKPVEYALSSIMTLKDAIEKYGKFKYIGSSYKIYVGGVLNDFPELHHFFVTNERYEEVMNELGFEAYQSVLLNKLALNIKPDLVKELPECHMLAAAVDGFRAGWKARQTEIDELNRTIHLMSGVVANLYDQI